MGTGRQRISTAAPLEAKAGERPVLELEHVLVQEELEHAPVAAERELAQAAAVLEHGLGVVEPERVLVAAELELVRVAAPAPNLRPDQLEARRKTRSATEAHHRDLAPLLAAEEDLAAAAETMREQAAIEAATVWAAAVTAAVAALE